MGKNKDTMVKVFQHLGAIVRIFSSLQSIIEFIYDGTHFWQFLDSEPGNLMIAESDDDPKSPEPQKIKQESSSKKWSSPKKEFPRLNFYP